jgi:hypothetical protein
MGKTFCNKALSLLYGLKSFVPEHEVLIWVKSFVPGHEVAYSAEDAVNKNIPINTKYSNYYRKY